MTGAGATERTGSARRTSALLGGRRGQYLLIRVTGVLLAVLAIGHYGLTHIVNDVAETDSTFVAQRWSSALWVGWDGLLLATALLHALAGTATVIRDHRAEAGSRRRWIAASAGGTIVLLLLGLTALTYVVLGDTPS